MIKRTSSYSQILRSSAIVGGASVITILVGLLRTKALAMFVGPAGVGMVGLYGGLMSAATGLASMGVGIVGTRQISEAMVAEDARALAVARRAILLGTLFLACTGAFMVWTLRELLALHVLGSAEHAGIVGWLALGVAISMASASQAGVIQGMRRIGDMARLNVYSTILNTAFGVTLLWLWGEAGLVAFVLAGPLISFVLGHGYVARIPRSSAEGISISDMTSQWKLLLRLGLPFMGAGFVGSLLQLWIRVEVSDNLGSAALGYYQAASLISTQYIGFVLISMGADYYPRLTGVIQNSKAAVACVNEQAEMALLLSAPALIGMMALAPWVIELMYSHEFAPATEVLRWQILGDVFKLASWSLAFVILAAGDGRTYFWSDTLPLLVMALLITGMISSVGLKITGIAYFICYIVHFSVVYILATRRIQFRWSSVVVGLFLITILSCVGVGVLIMMTPWGALVGVMGAAVFGIYSLSRLSRMSDLHRHAGRLGTIVIRLRAMLPWGRD